MYFYKSVQSHLALCYRHNVNEVAGHLVQGVEYDGVLPGEDGDGDGAVAHHKVGLKPGGAEARVRVHGAGQGLKQD